MGRLSGAIRVAVIGAAVLAAMTACIGLGRQPALRSSPTPPIPVASPYAFATWASFTTGADKPHATLSGGLQVTDVQIGNGTVARTHDQLTIRYILWLGDGRQVDSTDSAGHPFKFMLGTGEVIQGLDDGLLGMAVEGTRRLVIPPSLAYGDQGAVDNSGAWVIPPNTTLVFIVELLADVPAS